MNTDEINRYIHEQIMGKCWHKEFRPHREHPHTLMTCAYCNHSMGTRQAHDGAGVPDYCSDESPRRRLNEVVDKVTDKVPIHIFCQDVLTQMDNSWSLKPEVTTAWLLTAPAEQIARACVEAHKELK